MILIVLDVDGTLVDAEGAARRAMNQTLKDLFGVTAALEQVPRAGLTDRQILLTAYQQHELPVPPDWPALVERYAGILAQGLATRPGHAIVGAKAFLERMALRDDVALALGTGNFRQGAYLKLGAHGMAGFFPVGGFGDDGETRAELVKAAVDRAKGYYGDDFAGRTLIVGDTPLDVQGAHAAGHPCLSVATGKYGIEELQGAGGEGVVADLSHAEPVIQRILGPSWQSRSS